LFVLFVAQLNLLLDLRENLEIIEELKKRKFRPTFAAL